MAQYKKSDDFKDSDKDGLSDEAEEYFGTNPNNPDTDADGMSDRDEIVRGRNPKGPGMLRDLFIPHAGNNYHPHALHPKRVAFHAASALAVKALVIAIMLALPATAWLTPDILREQQQKIISLTNSVRQNLGIPALAERQTLNQAADYKARDMLALQYFAHENPNGKRLSGFLGDAGYPFAVAGENLAIGFADAESVVNAWVKSPTHYANLIDAGYEHIGVGLISGEYNGFDTTLVAQYFGAPFSAEQEPQSEASNDNRHPGASVPASDRISPDNQQDSIAPSTGLQNDDQKQLRNDENNNENTEEPEQALGSREQFGDEKIAQTEPAQDALPEESSEPQEAEEESVQLAIDESQSVVYVLDNEDGGTIVRAIVRITGAISADVRFSGSQLELARYSGAPDMWIGSTTVFETDKEKLFDPAVLPAATARSASGQTVTQDLSWERVEPANPTLTQQYFFMREQDSGIIGALRAISSWYFTLMLALAAIALGLMVFVEIKKQHPRHIAASLGLIALLVLAIAL